MSNESIIFYYKSICSIMRYKVGFKIFHHYLITSCGYDSQQSLEDFITKTYPILKKEGLI